MPDVTAHEKQAVVLLRKVVSYDTKRTEALKAFALCLCEIRREMSDPAGTSQAYRDVAARIYAAVDIPADSASHIQASVRYHIGNELRNAFKPEELAAVGLSEKTPLERAREAREKQQAEQLPSATPEEKQANGGQAHITLPASVVSVEEVQILQAANPTKAGRGREKRDYRERPRVEIALPPDPIVVLGASLDALRTAASLPVIPASEIASLRDMLRRMRAELDRLDARLTEEEAHPVKPMPAKARTRTRKTPAKVG